MMAFVLFAYAVPLLALIVGYVDRLSGGALYRSLRGQRLRRVALATGHLEYVTGHLRDHTIGLVAAGMGAWHWAAIASSSGAVERGALQGALTPTVIALASAYAYRRHVRVGLAMTELMRANPLVHPGEYYARYYLRLGVGSVPVPATVDRIVDPANVSYRTGAAPRRSVWVLGRGLYDTALIARSAYLAITGIGEAYGREVFDAMASLWGSRMLQLFQLDLRVKGLERFSDLQGKILLVCNHKSHLDFVFTFFALSTARTRDGRRLRPRFIAARDHFVENTFVREWLGIGRLIAAVDMVFVDRKGKGVLAMNEAADLLVHKDIDIAVFPQGTRAHGVRDERGQRSDAGYYTTGVAERPLAHLKKGCAYLALDVALALQERQQPVHLVFIGIDGTGEVVPKGEIAIQTEGEIRFSVGDVLTLRSGDVEGLARPEGKHANTPAEERYQARVESLLGDINRGLVRALEWHERLVRWFDGELASRGLDGSERRAVLESLLRMDADGETLPFALLDHLRANAASAEPDTFATVATRVRTFEASAVLKS